MSKPLKGIITAIVTPFDKHENLLEPSYRQLIDFQIEKGIHGLFVLGTAGEGPKLPNEKRKKIAEVCVDHVNGRIPVILHVGTASTEMSKDLAKHAADIGADYIGVVGPYFYTYDLQCLVLHYKEIGSAADIPMLIYNNSGRQGYNITPSMFGAIAEEVPTLVGIKDTSHSVEQVARYYELFKRKFAILMGGDAVIYPALCAGADGEINTVSNAFPEYPLEVYNCFIKDDHAGALEAQIKANKIRDVLKVGPYLTPYKEACKLRGIDTGIVSKPLRPLTEKERAFLVNGLKKLNVI
jgi:4-hydroxy-tetrahydrodipicolinate synthase